MTGASGRLSPAPAAPATTLWERGREPGGEVVALGIAVALSLVVIDVAVTARVGWLFDLGFVPLCVLCALLVRPRDFFTAGVLPPLLMAGLFVLLGLTGPELLADADDGAAQALLTGLAHHSLALVLGYALALGCLVVRTRVREGRSPLPWSPRPRPRPAAQPKRSGSPAP